MLAATLPNVATRQCAFDTLFWNPFCCAITCDLIINIRHWYFILPCCFFYTLTEVVLRHTLPVFTGLGRCPIVNWDFCWSNEHFWTRCPSCRPPMTFTGIFLHVNWTHEIATPIYRGLKNLIPKFCAAKVQYHKFRNLQFTTMDQKLTKCVMGRGWIFETIKCQFTD